RRLMPRSYDLNPVSITHHPTQRIDTAIGKLPPFDIQQIIDGFLTALKDLIGIDLTGIRDFLENMFGSIDWSNLPDAGDVWQFVVSTFIQPIIDIVGQIGDALNAVLAPIFGGIDFNDLPTPGEVWQTVINTLMLPLNLLLGPGSRIELPQLPSVFLGSLTTASPNFLEAFSAMSVPTSDGWSYDSVADAAKVICDGSTKTLYLSGPVIPVESGQPLNISQKVRYAGVTSGAGQMIQYVLETFASDDGSGTVTPVVVDGITNPSGTASTVTIGDSDWDPPPGVESVRPVLVVDELVTAGTVFWENRPSLKKGLDPSLANGLPAVLNNLGDWIESLVDQMLGALGLPALGTLFDKITDLSDEIGDWLTDTLGTQSDLADLIGDLLAAPATVIGTITQGMVSGLSDLNTLTNQIRDILAGLVVTPIDSTVQAIQDWFTGLTGKTANLTTGGLFDAAKLSNITGTISQSLVTGLTGSLGDLQTTLNQIGDIFNNAVVTPINSVVQSVKDWWDEWFGGGSTNAIPLSQKGAANGVAPLDSSSLIPAQYIPGGVGGGGEPTDHILFTLAGNQSIPSGTATALTGWQQVGSVTATFDDGTNTRWTFPKAGWWDIQSQVVWDTSTTGKRQSAIVRTLSSGSVIPATDGADAADCPAWPVRNKIRDTQEVGVRSPLAATDKFSIEAYQNSGAALNAVAGYPDGTYVLATYLGQRQADAVTVMPVAFDARGGGGSVAASGSATTTWSHTATGLDRFVIVFAAFKPSSVTGLNCTASYGGVGMTRVAFLTSSSNVVLAAFVMEDPPTGAKTISVTASNSSGSVYLIADSLSYTGVGGYTVSNTALTSSTAMSQSVSSAANRMVAQAFAADGSNGLSAYSQTQRLTASYSSFVRMVAGDAAGAGTVNFTGTSSGGSSKYWGTAIDLHQVSV
ncbi:hypothetical protein, partial [Mycolicibacterium fortuitum]|uniref:hypothetical protein n=1 Tax=Mycolicibacterium fortuitum TaxID=1766 RepID=UPI00169A5F34|nr:hypothetical protein [Mycolicibacterium fortuitum]